MTLAKCYKISPISAANANDAPLISGSDSKVAVVIERTNEEWIAAVHGCELLERAG